MGERVIMNREILFKAKRKDNGEWVEGYYIYHIKRTICPSGDSVKPEDEQHVIMQDGFSDWNMPRGTVVYEIDQETLCQHTGLTDKNGKKIWENDIIKCLKRKEGYDIYKVVWRKWYADFGVEPIKPKYEAQYPIGLSDGATLHGRDYKVIGNIFDNPDLLEVK